MSFDIEKFLKQKKKRTKSRRGNGKRDNDVLLAFIGGAAAGIIGAVLMAPANGEDTLKKIKRKVNEISDDIVEWAESIQNKAETTAEEYDEEDLKVVKGTVKGTAQEVKGSERPKSGSQQ